MEFKPEDVRVDTFTTGTGFSKRDVSVRVTHIPTGLIEECGIDRSQHKNKGIAIQKLKERLADVPETQKNVNMLDKYMTVKLAHVETESMLAKALQHLEQLHPYTYEQMTADDHQIHKWHLEHKRKEEVK